MVFAVCDLLHREDACRGRLRQAAVAQDRLNRDLEAGDCADRCWKNFAAIASATADHSVKVACLVKCCALNDHGLLSADRRCEARDERSADWGAASPGFAAGSPVDHCPGQCCRVPPGVMVAAWLQATALHHCWNWACGRLKEPRLLDRWAEAQMRAAGCCWTKMRMVRALAYSRAAAMTQQAAARSNARMMLRA